MIKIFRNIRKKIITENKTIIKNTNYFKYAIGEIFLVVIGILLALQVNNWNEERKQKQVQINVLNEIKNDIQENIKNLNEGIQILDSAKVNILKIITYYEEKTPFNDSLLPSFYYFTDLWDPDFTYAGFENLKNQGVRIISNKTLRKSIINLFEVDMNILDISDVSRQEQITTSMALPIQKKYFFRDHKSTQFPWHLVPYNYNKMMQDNEFYSVCLEIAYRQTRSINRYLAFNSKAYNVIAKIDLELSVMK